MASALIYPATGMTETCIGSILDELMDETLQVFSTIKVAQPKGFSEAIHDAVTREALKALDGLQQPDKG